MWYKSVQAQVWYMVPRNTRILFVHQSVWMQLKKPTAFSKYCCTPYIYFYKGGIRKNNYKLHVLILTNNWKKRKKISHLY